MDPVLKRASNRSSCIDMKAALFLNTAGQAGLMTPQCNKMCSFDVHADLIVKYGASLDAIISNDVDREFVGSVYCSLHLI